MSKSRVGKSSRHPVKLYFCICDTAGVLGGELPMILLVFSCLLVCDISQELASLWLPSQQQNITSIRPCQIILHADRCI